MSHLELFEDTLSMPKTYNMIELYNTYARNDSPLTMSDNDDNLDPETNSQESLSIQIYDEFPKNYKYINELSIFITFLKGQKNMYLYASHITQMKSHILILTSLFITSGVTIFAPLAKNDVWTIPIIVILNALATLCISLANYWKLETSTTIYVHTAKQYEKIETNLEIYNEFNYYNMKNDGVKKIYELESKMKTMMDEKTIEIPTEVKLLYPIIYNVNVFALIKKLNAHNHDSKKEYAKIKNEIALIVKKYGGGGNLRVKNRLEYLLNEKEKVKKNMNHYENAFTYFDEICVRENTHAQIYKNVMLWMYLLCNRPPKYIVDPYHCNPLVDEYLLSIA
jgi:hypothetical protein